MQILVVIDGLSTHANTGPGHRPAAIARMAITTAERELGLPPGTLTPELSACGIARASSHADKSEAGSGL